MPLKRLRPDAPAGLHQTDLLFATSPIHARHFEETWGLRDGTVVVAGLPRNDALLRASTQVQPSTLQSLTRGRPLIVWLPTFRTSVGKVARTDGHDYGNVFQMPDADVFHMAEEFDRLGVHVLVKPHPSAPTPDPVNLPGLTIWRDEDVRRSGMSLYEILGHSRCLLTDHSSVWVDYLLLQRPLIFTVADLDAYSTSRGYYFTPISKYLPGPAVTSLPELYSLLGNLDDVERRWASSRAEALALHHTHVDGRSAHRAVHLTAERAGLIAARAGGVSPPLANPGR
jgi:CDP-glycerol glycerophosphotransferase (TagB/SpsB family)